MLIDGVNIPASANITKTVPDNKGATLPETVTNDAYFELTALDGSNIPGIYKGVSSSWVFVSGTEDETYDLAVTVSGSPANSAIVLRFIAPRQFTLPEDFLGSLASAVTAATASTVFTVKRNDSTTEGTITFAASGTTGAFSQSTTGDMVFAAGDVLSIEAPASADATLANISVTFRGFLSD